MTETTPAVLQTSGLGKRYRKRRALADCTLTVPAGRIVGLVGPNGAGKSTLLNLAAGLLRPTEGTVRVFGAAPAADAAQAARVGFVAQDAPLYANLTVADHLRLGAKLNPRWDADLASARTAAAGLVAKAKARTLSGGQRAQLALTLAVAKHPDLLLLDEPAAALDPLARREFLDGLTAAVTGTGTTVVLSSHLVSDLERVCDHLIILTGARVQAAGPVSELLAAHRAGAGPAATVEDMVLAALSRGRESAAPGEVGETDAANAADAADKADAAATSNESAEGGTR